MIHYHSQSALEIDARAWRLRQEGETYQAIATVLGVKSREWAPACRAAPSSGLGAAFPHEPAVDLGAMLAAAVLCRRESPMPRSTRPKRLAGTGHAGTAGPASAA
jgi:hypothetical protein